ncbi:MAG: TIGR04255 family protein [Planctomycetota bacterium]
MSNPIELNEEFPHLSKAPIIEAAIEIRIVPHTKWDESTIINELKQRFPDYPKIEPLKLTKIQISPSANQKNQSFDLGCVGFKLHSGDNLNIVQFNKGAFIFSRLKPYVNWEPFCQEAFRLLTIYHDLFKLGLETKIIRIGLRFINRISIKHNNVKLADYYQYPPESLKNTGWPLSGYLHHDVMQIPDTDYSVNLIKTIQNIPDEIGLILDIDVFTQPQFQYNDSKLINYLEEMRWIKNKIFFSSITDKVLSELK